MAVKNLGASPEAFGGTGAVRSVTIHGRHGGRPSSIKAEASFGVSDPMGMNDFARMAKTARAEPPSMNYRAAPVRSRLPGDKSNLPVPEPGKVVEQPGKIFPARAGQQEGMPVVARTGLERADQVAKIRVVKILHDDPDRARRRAEQSQRGRAWLVVPLGRRAADFLHRRGGRPDLAGAPGKRLRNQRLRNAQLPGNLRLCGRGIHLSTNNKKLDICQPHRYES